MYVQEGRAEDFNVCNLTAGSESFAAKEILSPEHTSANSAAPRDSESSRKDKHELVQKMLSQRKQARQSQEQSFASSNKSNRQLNYNEAAATELDTGLRFSD